jgi:hypothetical protein
MGDMCWQVSWLAAQTLSPAFPASDQTDPDQWHSWCKLAAYSCGGSPGIAHRALKPFSTHRIPIFTGHNLRRTGTFTIVMCSDQITAVKRESNGCVARKTQAAVARYKNFLLKFRKFRNPKYLARRNVISPKSDSRHLPGMGNVNKNLK